MTELLSTASTVDQDLSKLMSSTNPTETNCPPADAAGPKAGSAANGINQEKCKSLQLIDGEQNFSEDVGKYMDAEWKLADQGFDYNVVAVFGSQSTGKSTLLNKLFGTKFATMEENTRQQTTKGIWMSKGIGMDVLVMDVEGTDGRERGENQDFERKSALFSLATAEVMIVNLWEHMVGLYNGANMGLLKTVFEVNLQLFQKKGKEKTLLFFVIRDFIGNTPLENLARTVTTDLEKIWRELSKPEGLEDCNITDFFDTMFTALPHKILMPEKFDDSVDVLRNRFMDKQDENYVFRPRYHKRIPADGFPHYASAIWEKIITNRDLDLPTQQELLAQYRCDEILNAAYAEFMTGVKPFQRPIESGKVVDVLGENMKTYLTEALAAFDKNASRYHQQVYQRKREEMTAKCHATLHVLFLGQLKNLHKRATQQFGSLLQERMAGATYDFLHVVTEAREAVLDQFKSGAQAILLEDTDWTVEDTREQLEEDLSEIAAQRRVEEINKMITTFEKSIRKEVEELVGLHLNEAKPELWKLIFDNYKQVEEDAEQKLIDRAERFGAGETEQKDCATRLRRRGWECLNKKVRDELADNMVLIKLRNRLEEKFRYDEQGLPRVWKPEDDMDSYFQQAKNEAFKLIPLFARMDWSKSELEVPDHFADDPEFDYTETLTIYSASKQQDINTRFRREAEAMFLEAKRSIVATEAKVPYWMIVLVCVLGWNEFITILTSPMYLVLFSTLGFVGYVRMARGIASQGATMIKDHVVNSVANSRNSTNSNSEGEAVPMTPLRSSTA
ncbi:RHD3/Sey1 [Syncephalis fuscata]|nr:RHD3/Sey1 [Syncephalis fuscata]